MKDKQMVIPLFYRTVQLKIIELIDALFDRSKWKKLTERDAVLIPKEEFVVEKDINALMLKKVKLLLRIFTFLYETRKDE
jgi:hypothetical protein